MTREPTRPDNRQAPEAAFPRGLRREPFGRYGLLALLGQGGMGRLYLAEKRGIQGFVKIVALKQILPHLADSQQLREMFLNEARIAAKLEHPNIVATYELGEVEGKYFISMEYLPGEDFATIIARCQGDRRLPIEIATALAQQAAQGLHHAHESRDEAGRLLGLVHRDVNPRNLFLTYHGVVKVLDFGIVRGREGPRTNPGAFKGKYGYCAPEQLEGGQVDRRTDVFCLGIVLWECLTGARLFEGGSDAATIDAVRSRPVEPPSALRPEIPPALDGIVRRALARDPAHRFQSAHDLSEELDAFLLERDMRPTSKSVGRWLESMFGADRASLKKAISQGASVEATLAKLAALETSAPGGGTSPGHVTARRVTTLGGAAATLPSADSSLAPPPRPSPPRRAAAAVLAAAALVAGGAVVVSLAGAPSMNATSAARPAAARGTGGLDVTSDPPGAHVFVDGSPSGLKTPAVLAGLAAGTRVSIRLDKDGYAPITKELEISEGAPVKASFALRPATGTLRVTGAPPRAVAYLDDSVVDVTKPLETPAGTHRLRLEVDQTVLVSKSLEVSAGAETALDVNRERSGP
jgi:serine/threonine-protein kinase